MSEDHESMVDLGDVIDAVESAREALRKAMDGDGQGREKFLFSIVFALGRLRRVAERIDRQMSALQ